MARRGCIARLLQQAAVGQGDAGGEIPGDRKLVGAAVRPGAAAGAPDQGQIGLSSPGGQHAIEGEQPPLAGQVGGEQGVEVHHIGRRAGEHSRQQLALHRRPGHVGPDHVVAGVAALPLADDPLDGAVELGRQIQGPELDRAWRGPLGSPAGAQASSCRGGSQDCGSQGKQTTAERHHHVNPAATPLGASAAAAASTPAVPEGR